MKKILLFMFCGVMLFSFVSCGTIINSNIGILTDDKENIEKITINIFYDYSNAELHHNEKGNYSYYDNVTFYGYDTPKVVVIEEKEQISEIYDILKKTSGIRINKYPSHDESQQSDSHFDVEISYQNNKIDRIRTTESGIHIFRFLETKGNSNDPGYIIGMNEEIGKWVYSLLEKESENEIKDGNEEASPDDADEYDVEYETAEIREARAFYDLWLGDHPGAKLPELSKRSYQIYELFGESYWRFRATEDEHYWFNILVHMETGELLYMMTSDGMFATVSIEPLDDWYNRNIAQ